MFNTWDMTTSPKHKQDKQNQRETNTKNLSDLCLQCIANNLHSIPRCGRYLASVHKEALIELLACHDQLTPQYLPHVTYNLFSSNLKCVNFYKCDQVTDSVLKLLASSKCQLRFLTIHGCTEVTDVGIHELLRDQTSLESLVLSKLAMTGAGLQGFASPLLEKVSLRGCGNVLSEGVTSLVTNNPTIRNLNLVLCNKLDETVFTGIAKSLNQNLEMLDLSCLNIPNDSSLISIAEHCPHLKKLLLYGCNRVTDKGLSKVFECCRELSVLDVSYCSRIQDAPSVDCLRMLPASLQELTLCGVLVQDTDLLVESVINLKRLKTIRLCGVPAITNETLEQVLCEIGPSLEELDLSGGSMSDHITDAGMAAVARHCGKLRTLALNMLRQVTGVTLLPLLTNPVTAENLTTLLLSCRKIDPEVLYSVADHCRNLQKLDFCGLDFVEDSLLISLAEQCPSLSFINLKGCRKVTDAGVCALARSCPLTITILSGINNLTDASIFTLANCCPYLEEIYLSGCYRVTRTAIRYLQDCCIPRVFFYHKVPNAQPNLLMAKNLDTGEFCRIDVSDL